MNPGELDTLISVERVSEESGEVGDIVETWVPLLKTWASKRYLRGRELMEARQLVAEVDLVFETWYCKALMTDTPTDPKDRIVSGDQIFDVKYIIPIPGGRPTSLQYYCQLRQA